MKKRKSIIFSILVCLIFSLGFILTNHNETHHSNQVNVVMESKEKLDNRNQEKIQKLYQ
jgi:uncharacterized membrane protein